MGKLEETIASIQPLDAQAMAAAAERQNNLIKPLGSLGRLEELSIRVAGIQAKARPQIENKVIVTMAGDHGVCAEGVSAYPPAVTPQMVFNFLRGGAAINALARHVGARMVIVDVGVAEPMPEHPGLLNRKVALGTANMAQGPAMTRAQAVQALEVGIEVVERELARGLDIVGTGDMGIGNTTPSSAIVSVFTGEPAALLTGRGTGLNDEQLRHKIAVIERALAVNRPDPTDGLDVLAKVGGLRNRRSGGSDAGRRLPPRGRGRGRLHLRRRGASCPRSVPDGPRLHGRRPPLGRNRPSGRDAPPRFGATARS